MTLGHGLIVDVGMARGEDTEFYLRKGFRVLALEANPDFVAEVSDRLCDYIAHGQLQVLNIAIAGHQGEVEFFASDDEGWGSTRRDWVESRQALGVGFRSQRVPCDTLANLLADREQPHFLKIDIEGSDALCIEQLSQIIRKPRYLSVECDPVSSVETLQMLSRVHDYGYRNFKLLNQVNNPMLRCPNPSLEGDYFDAQFSLSSSGPFGEETPGEWVDFKTVKEQYLAVSKQQAMRAQYTASGRVFGLPLGRLHRQLHWAYNHPVTKTIRRRYASARGRELGGWFDIHARLET